MFALGPLIPYMLQYTLLFICGDVDVSHELAGFVCISMEGGREKEGGNLTPTQYKTECVS